MVVTLGSTGEESIPGCRSYGRDLEAWGEGVNVMQCCVRGEREGRTRDITTYRQKEVQEEVGPYSKTNRDSYK